MALSRRLSNSQIKIIVTISLAVSFFVDVENVDSIFNGLHGIPIFEKIYFAGVISNPEANTNFRFLALTMVLFILGARNYDSLTKAAAVIYAIGLILTIFPLIGIRVGFISTSVLAGHFVYNFFKTMTSRPNGK